MWPDRDKRLHINGLGVKAMFFVVSKSDSVDSQLNSGSLCKQTGRNPLSRDVCSPLENHELLQNLIMYQAHSRVTNCDCQLIVRVD